MAFARTILALVTALSVAVLLAAGGVVVNAKSYDAEMIAAGSTDDCCPDNRCDKAAHECGSMATCALHCFNFMGGRSSLGPGRLSSALGKTIRSPRLVFADRNRSEPGRLRA